MRSLKKFLSSLLIHFIFLYNLLVLIIMRHLVFHYLHASVISLGWNKLSLRYQSKISKLIWSCCESCYYWIAVLFILITLLNSLGSGSRQTIYWAPKVPHVFYGLTCIWEGWRKSSVLHNCVFENSNNISALTFLLLFNFWWILRW